MSDRQYLKLSWIFSIAGTDEIAVTSLNLSQIALPFTGAAAALAEINLPTIGASLLNRMDTMLSAAPVQWAAYSFLDVFRIAAVGVDGLEIGDAKEFEDATTRQGLDNIVNPQMSIVVSTRSTLSTGKANFGRMYLPHSQLVLENGTPSATATSTTQMATAAQVFIQGVVDDVDAQTTVGVDAMIITHITGAASKPILGVSVGDVNDTQRRRRRQLPEVYSNATITPNH